MANFNTFLGSFKFWNYLDSWRLFDLLNVDRHIADSVVNPSCHLGYTFAESAHLHAYFNRPFSLLGQSGSARFGNRGYSLHVLRPQSGRSRYTAKQSRSQ